VDLLQCESDQAVGPHTFVRLPTGDSQVDFRWWSRGVGMGILGASADMPADAKVAWIEPADDGSSPFEGVMHEVVRQG
jgi:hypothetical protein